MPCTHAMQAERRAPPHPAASLTYWCMRACLPPPSCRPSPPLPSPRFRLLPPGCASNSLALAGAGAGSIRMMSSSASSSSTRAPSASWTQADGGGGAAEAAAWLLGALAATSDWPCAWVDVAAAAFTAAASAAPSRTYPRGATSGARSAFVQPQWKDSKSHKVHMHRCVGAVHKGVQRTPSEGAEDRGAPWLLLHRVRHSADMCPGHTTAAPRA